MKKKQSTLSERRLVVVFESEDSTCSGCRFLENTIAYIGIESWRCQLFNKGVDEQSRLTVLGVHPYSTGGPLTPPIRLAECRSGELPPDAGDNRIGIP